MARNLEAGPLSAHLHRPLAECGIRRSRLICLSDGGRAVTLDLVAGWTARHGRGASIFCVSAGNRLGGTTVLMREQPEVAADLWIWLPTSKAVRRLGSGQIDDWILGSDFVYDDFRIWTPRLLSEAEPLPVLAGAGELIFSGSYEWRQMAVQGNAVLDCDSGLVRSASWARRGASAPFRRMEARGIRVIDGTATPRELIVSREGGFESRMKLVAQVCGIWPEGLSLVPEDLPTAGGVLWRAATELGLGEPV